MLCMVLSAGMNIALTAKQDAPLHPSDYKINTPEDEQWHGRDALYLLDQQLKKEPKLERRLLDADMPVENDGGETWGYLDQAYANRNIMRHLVANQIKAMAEAGELSSIEEAFNEDVGIGSKYHKDKGTIGDVFSFWGHPVQEKVLGGGKFKALEVYHAFRKTIKNKLKSYLRSQPVSWHRQTVSKRTRAIMKYLKRHHVDSTTRLKRQLKKKNMTLRALIQRALKSNLLS